MAIWEYFCNNCLKRYAIRTKQTTPYSTKCPRCGDQGDRVPSVPGYRRDHTVL